MSQITSSLSWSQLCVHTVERRQRVRHKELFCSRLSLQREVGRKMTACWLCVVLLSSGCNVPPPALSPHTHRRTILSPPDARLWSQWILIHCIATEIAQHRSENIWQALFIDPAGRQAESTATWSSLFWSRVPQKSPRRKELQSPGAGSRSWSWRGKSFFYGTPVAIMGAACCCGDERDTHVAVEVETHVMQY